MRKRKTEREREIKIQREREIERERKRERKSQRERVGGWVRATDRRRHTEKGRKEIELYGRQGRRWGAEDKKTK